MALSRIAKKARKTPHKAAVIRILDGAREAIREELEGDSNGMGRYVSKILPTSGKDGQKKTIGRPIFRADPGPLEHSRYDAERSITEAQECLKWRC